MEKTNSEKIVALALVGIAAAGGIGAAIGASMADDSKQLEEVQAKLAEAEAKLNVTVEPVIETVEVPVNVTKIEYVNVTEEVLVDNGNLDLVLEEVYDNNGQVEYLIDDLDDDEVDQIVERIVFANDVKSLAVQAVKDELADEVDNLVVVRADNSTVELDEDDVEKLRIDDDDDEVVIDEIDYEDKDAEVLVTGRFKHDDEWFSFEAEVEIEDGKLDDVSVSVSAQ